MVIQFNDIEKQLDALKTPWCDQNWASVLYGLELRKEELLLGRFRTWAMRFKKKKNVMNSGGIDRFAFESFLQFSQLLPFRYAAARLGMTEASLREILDKMSAEGILSYNMTQDTQGTVSKRLVDDFVQFFPRLSREMPDEHSEYCRRLHETLRTELNIEIESLICDTSKQFRDEPREYAYEFDMLTSEPVSVKYQLWLDIGKPVSLKPDVFSVKTFFSHKKLLKNHLFGNYDIRLEEMEEKFDV